MDEASRERRELSDAACAASACMTSEVGTDVRPGLWSAVIWTHFLTVGYSCIVSKRKK